MIPTHTPHLTTSFNGHAAILVIDSDPLALSMMGNILSEAGYDVHSACDWETGLRMAVTELPGLILLDVEAAESEGFEALRRLK